MIVVWVGKNNVRGVNEMSFRVRLQTVDEAKLLESRYAGTKPAEAWQLRPDMMRIGCAGPIQPKTVAAEIVQSK